MGSGASRNSKGNSNNGEVIASKENTEVDNRIEVGNPASPVRSSPSRRSEVEYSPRSRDNADSAASSPRDEEEDEALRAHFAQSAMSLGMDNDDLIFNLLYFGDAGASFQTMFNSAVEETVAAHSASNTPYKLHPATEEALGKLKVVFVSEETVLEEKECSICQEDMDIGNEIVFMPDCRHCFHDECVKRWFTLQSWCPVCRTQIIPNKGGSTHEESELATERRNLASCFEDEYEGCDNGDGEGANCQHYAGSAARRSADEDEDWGRSLSDDKHHDDDCGLEDSLEQSSVHSAVAKHAMERVMDDVWGARARDYETTH